MPRIMTPEQQRDWIEQTMLDLQMGNGTPEQVDALRQLLMQDPAAREVYLRFNQLDCHLASRTKTEPIAVTTSPDPDKKRWFPYLVGSLTGAGIAAAVVFALVKPKPHIPDNDLVATNTDTSLALLTSESGTNLSGDAIAESGKLNKGNLSLKQGIAQLRFKNGAQIVLEGKCGFEIAGENHIVLNHGKMWAYCPPEAYGFRVTTPGGNEIIDLGTEFGINVSLDGNTDVHVLDGLVEVKSKGKVVQQLADGEALGWGKMREPSEVPFAGYNQFVTSETLQNKRISSYKKHLLERDDLILYYDFNKIGNKGKIQNLAKNAPKGTHGQVSSPITVIGRTSEEGALLFEKRENAVTFNLKKTEDITTFTVAAWVRVNQLKNSRSAVINSRAWKPGAMHLQFTRRGEILHGIKGSKAFISPPSTIQEGKWHLVAVVRNTDTGETDIYCDGIKLPIQEYVRKATFNAKASTIEPRFGLSSIGDWVPTKNQRITDRSLNGRIDELMIFGRDLSTEELQKLYVTGKP